MKVLAFILISAVVLLIGVQSKRYEDRFQDYGVYIVTNREFQGVLTFGNSTENNPNITQWKVPLSVQDFNGTNSGQKWRLDESSLFTAFELRPTLNEQYVLQYIPDKGILRWLSIFGNTKLWYLQDAGEGFTAIKHKRYEVCLDSAGNGLMVMATKCNGAVSQQWKFDVSKGA